MCGSSIILDMCFFSLLFLFIYFFAMGRGSSFWTWECVIGIAEGCLHFMEVRFSLENSFLPKSHVLSAYLNDGFM